MGKIGRSMRGLKIGIRGPPLKVDVCANLTASIGPVHLCPSNGAVAILYQSIGVFTKQERERARAGATIGVEDRGTYGGEGIGVSVCVGSRTLFCELP